MGTLFESTVEFDPLLLFAWSQTILRRGSLMRLCAGIVVLVVDAVALVTLVVIAFSGGILILRLLATREVANEGFVP